MTQHEARLSEAIDAYVKAGGTPEGYGELLEIAVSQLHFTRAAARFERRAAARRRILGLPHGREILEFETRVARRLACAACGRACRDIVFCSSCCREMRRAGGAI